MTPGQRSASRPTGGERLATGLACAVLVVCFLFGGASRPDAFSQFFVRVGVVLLGAAALLGVTRYHLARVKWPLGLCAAWTGLMLIQLLPLPPALWTALPGREMFVGIAGLAGIEQPWRPISLSPESTVNSALAMLVPLAVLITACQVPARRMPLLMAVVVLFAIVSGLIGVVQVATHGALYFYAVTNNGDAVGLFANRNHQAMLLATMVPLLGAFAVLRREPATSQRDGTLALIVFALIFPLIFVTGSRAGLLLLVLGVGLAIAIIAKAARGKLGARGMRPSPLVIVAAAGIFLAGGAMAIFRVGSVARLLSRDVGQDLRVSLFDTMVSMAERYFPVGGGFGSFTDLFKIHEPLASLSYFYVNHAHNDLLELVIEGGLPAVILAVAALVWAASASLRIWRRRMTEQSREVHLLGLVASAMLLLLLIASVSDYPLRTPALAAVATLCAVIVSRADRTLAREANAGASGPREIA